MMSLKTLISPTLLHFAVASVGAGGLAAASLGGVAHGATLSGNLTGDNTFVAYLSTSAATLGLPIAAGQTWENVQSINAVPLLSGANYFLQIVVINYDSSNVYGSPITPSDLAAGNPDMFEGSFNITGLGFNFVNGTTALSTDIVDWKATVDPDPAYFGPSYSSAWSAPTGTPVSFGTNASPGIWQIVAANYLHTNGVLPGILPTADRIWAPGTDTGEAFFETEIIDPPIVGVPEPTSWALLLLGFGGIGALVRHRRNAVSAV